jgi:hypothetical protein
MRPVISGFGLVAAFLGGMALESARSKPRIVAAEPEVCRPAAPAAAVVADLAPLRAEIRALRQELADGRTAAAPAAAPAQPPGDPQAFAEAQQLITAAHTTHRWRLEDALAMRALLGRLSAAERDEVMSTLYTALNNGAIQPDDDTVRSPI